MGACIAGLNTVEQSEVEGKEEETSSRDNGVRMRDGEIREGLACIGRTLVLLSEMGYKSKVF